MTKCTGIIFIFLLVTVSGCSIPIAKLSYVTPSNKRSSKLRQSYIHKVPEKVTSFEAKDCIRIISIIPTGFHLDFEGVINKSCSGKDLYNVTVVDKFWYIPFIYGEECVVAKGVCEQ